MSDSELKPGTTPPRLCGEIQLFDLCDLDSCNHKNSHFCTDSALLDRFEKIAEDELRTPECNVSEEIDDAEEEEYDGDDEFTMKDLDNSEDDGWEDKE